jgi:hypothetical protein
MTKQAIEALRWYATNGEEGQQPPYAIVRALIEHGYVSPAGAITVKGLAVVQKAQQP